MNNETMVIAPAPVETQSVISGVDGPAAILTTGASVSENMAGAVEILGQGMASIFVVLGIIAVFVSWLKKLDNKKK